MDCLDAKQKLEPCARGELGPTDRAELDRHIASCEGCRLELELTRAVLGSSTGESADEADIQQERMPELPDHGPQPPRVLTSQLPEDAEEPLDLESLHSANAYDPGAIDLPHPEPSPSFEEAASLPAAPLPESVSFAELADDSLTPPSRAKAASAAPASAGTGASWGFEPVDVPRSSAPPEESLSFAKEALDRKRGRALQSQKGARLLLWVGGAVGGVGLLGVSVWMALAFRDAPVGQDPSNVPALQPPPGVDGTSPDSSAKAQEAIPGLTGTDSLSASGSTPLVLQAGTAGSVAMPGLTPPNGAVSKPSAGMTQDVARASGTQPVPAKSPESTKTGKPVASPPPVAFRDDELAPAPRREPKILTAEPDAPPGSDAVYETQPDPVATKDPTKSVSTAPIFVPPSSQTRSSTGSSTTTDDPAASSPIGRLHVATVTAEKNRDLEALRKLKEPWKSMIRSTAGTERSRAKRELADCLWAIQEITGRAADRKDALAAYREYVLHAPAGGADARSVSRMRHLEDLLSDAQ
jgi:hypothetical protein